MMCPSSDAIASVYALQTGHGGRACGGTGHAAGSKAYRSCEEAIRDHQGHAANIRDNSAHPWIPHASSLVPKPLTNLSLILAASSGPLVMVFGRRLYVLQTHKATWVTHRCTVLYERE